MPEIYLKVDSAYPEDQGAGKVRLDPDTMLQLRLSPGNIVVLEGKRRTVAKVWRSMVSDWHQGKVRVDNFTRANAGVSIGDRVRIQPVEEEIEAKRVVLAPPEDMPRQIPINFQAAANRLIDFPVVKNDSVPIQAGLPFMQPQLMAFKAVMVDPEQAVIITRNTQVEFSDKPAAGFEGLKRISYEDIGGLKDELQRVRETIELPMRHPELFRKLGIEPPKGVLLHGPPGTGKTLIAKAVASESGAHFILIAGPEIISKYYGESEQRLREVFEEARQNPPSIIFIDELDSIAPRREDVTGEVERRVVAQLLTTMDGLEERGQVVVIGATNRVDAIDPALRRGGRFDREIEIGVPSEIDRNEILGIHTRGMPCEGESLLIKQRQQMNILNDELQGINNKINNEVEKIAKLKLQSQAIITEIGGAKKHKEEITMKRSELQNADRKERRGSKANIEDLKEIEINSHQIEREIEKLHDQQKTIQEDISLNQKSVEILKHERNTLERQIGTAQLEVKLLEEETKKNKENILVDFAKRTKGFVGADLAALAREAAIRALRRHLPQIDLEAKEIPQDVINKMEVLSKDFNEAFREIGPSAMREVLLEVPHVRWDDVGGLDAEKEEVREAVEYPLSRSERFEALGIEPPKGVLLYGPPGTGKTLIAQAVATESGANFIPVRGPQLLSKWVGESERAVREVFKKARQVAPAIIFFDELDALAPSRGSDMGTHVLESVLNQILTEIDGLLELRGVVVMGATNRPDIVDPALLRPGRFDRLVYIGEPSEEDRARILSIHTRSMPVEGSSLDNVISTLQPLTDSALEDLGEKLGKDRTVAPGEIATAAEGLARLEDGKLLPRKRVLEFLSARHLVVEDPSRDALIASMARATSGYVGSDLDALCREAGMLAMREGALAVTEKHFTAATAKIHPTMNERSREYYRRIREHFKGGLPKEVQPPEYA